MSRRGLFGFLVLALMLSFQSPVAAHTGFESSNPADGETVGSPVGEIVLVFSGPAEPVDDGFVVRDPNGIVRVPDQVASDDGHAWRLSFDPAIESGVVAVRWTVQAPDAHPIGGSFVFTVETGSTPAVAAPQAGATTTSTSVVSDSIDTARNPASDDGVPAAAAATAAESAVVGLEEFLEQADTGPVGRGFVGFLGRLFGMAGAMLGVGGVVFVLTVLSPLDEERRLVLGWVMVAGLVVAVGGVLESIAQAVATADRWTLPSLGSFFGGLGRAVTLRVGGGIALASYAVLAMRRLRRRQLPVTQQELVTVGAKTETTTDPPGVADGASPPASLGGVWLSAVAAVGAVGVVGSYSFDGHTVTAGERLLTSAVDFVHVLTGAVWIGGVAALAGVLRSRQRQGAALGGLGLGLRFSRVAAIALAVAGATGVVLAVTVLDSVGALWSTSWGQLLLAKTSVVLAAVGVGAYNHFRVVPWMALDSSDDDRSRRLRKTVTVEAALLVTVVAVTAALVAANSTS